MIENFSKEKIKKMSHVKNMVIMAQKDGLIAGSESQLIDQVGTSLGLTTSEIDWVIRDYDQIPQFIPESSEEKLGHLYSLVKLMLIDGDINKEELKYCGLAAIKVGLKEQDAIDTILTLVGYIEQGKTVAEVTELLRDKI